LDAVPAGCADERQFLPFFNHNVHGTGAQLAWSSSSKVMLSSFQQFRDGDQKLTNAFRRGTAT
jgi:hypothetical protein